MNTKKYRRHSWLDSRITARDSPINGKGLFASAHISAGETVAIMGGTVITDDELEQLARVSSYSSAAIGSNLNLLQAEDDPIRYGNHSCDPNVWLVDEVTGVARRDISAGEELTSDYATMTGFAEWRMPCNCGSANCRGTVTGEDWRLPELQRRYRGHFSPFLNKRIERFPLDQG